MKKLKNFKVTPIHCKVYCIIRADEYVTEPDDHGYNFYEFVYGGKTIAIFLASEVEKIEVSDND